MIGAVTALNMVFITYEMDNGLSCVNHVLGGTLFAVTPMAITVSATWCRRR